MDKKVLKTSSKGTNYNTARLIRAGNTVNEALSIAQQTEQMLVADKKSKRRKRLGI